MRDQAGMDAVLQGRAVPDQVQAETRALALGSSWSCTKRAPLIDSIVANTGSFASPSRRTNDSRPSPSGRDGAALEALPIGQERVEARRLRLRSNPTYNIKQASSAIGLCHD